MLATAAVYTAHKAIKCACTARRLLHLVAVEAGQVDVGGGAAVVGTPVAVHLQPAADPQPCHRLQPLQAVDMAAQQWARAGYCSQDLSGFQTVVPPHCAPHSILAAVGKLASDLAVALWCAVATLWHPYAIAGGGSRAPLKRL